MLNKKYKSLQRMINKSIHQLNENIANDDVWKGRFYAHQSYIHFYTYEDKSGVNAIAKIELVDKLTKETQTVFLNKFEIVGIFKTKFTLFGYGLWEHMNSFVCKQTRGLNLKQYKTEGTDFTNNKRWSR